MVFARNNVVLSVAWKEGVSKICYGEKNETFTIKMIQLIFENCVTEITVDIPENISSDKKTNLKFRFRQYQEKKVEVNGFRFQPIAKESYPKTIYAEIKQVQELKMKVAGSIPKNEVAEGEKSETLPDETTAFSMDHAVIFEVPKDIEKGKRYCIEISSNGKLPLTAKLVKAPN